MLHGGFKADLDGVSGLQMRARDLDHAALRNQFHDVAVEARTRGLKRRGEGVSLHFLDLSLR